MSIVFVVTFIQLLNLVLLPNSAYMEEMTTQCNAMCISTPRVEDLLILCTRGIHHSLDIYRLNFYNSVLFVCNTKAEQISPMEANLGYSI